MWRQIAEAIDTPAAAAFLGILLGVLIQFLGVIMANPIMLRIGAGLFAVGLIGGAGLLAHGALRELWRS